jgi:hypothetical protein
MTLPRDYWNATFIPGQTEVFVKNFTCFGWIVQQVIIPENAKMIVVSQNTVQRNKTPNLALYVRGLASVTNDETGAYPNREPGLFTANRPEHPKGITTIQALQETELWCFNYLINRRALPQVDKVFISAGSNYTVQPNQLLFVCSGKLDTVTPGQEVDKSGTLIAEQDTYAFVVGARRV